MSRRGLNYPRTRGSRRATNWVQGPAEADGAITASVKQLWSSSVITDTGHLTIVRTRGILRVLLNTVDAIGAGFFGACGIGLVQNDAFAVGVTALPGPISDSSWEGWLWHSFWDIRSVTATIADGVNAAAATMLLEIDSKAMRKWDEGQTLIGITEATEDVNATMELQADTRVLTKDA